MLEAAVSGLFSSPPRVSPGSAPRFERVESKTPAPVREFPKAPFVSPRIRVDVDANRAVIEIREGETGDVVQQYPTEQQMRAFERAKRLEDARQRLEFETEQRSRKVETPTGSREAQPSRTAEAPDAAPRADLAPTPRPQQAQAPSAPVRVEVADSGTAPVSTDTTTSVFA